MSTPVATLTPEEAYRRWARTYDTTESPLLMLEERHLDPKLGSLSGCDVLDIGCGTGRWLRKLSTLGARFLNGIDSSEAMLSIARKTCPPQVRLHQASAAFLPLPDNSVDLVMASFLLSYVPSLDPFVHEVERVLRPGGRLLLSDLHPEARTNGWRSTFRFRQSVYAIATYPYSLEDLQNSLYARGFVTEFCEEPRFDEPERLIFLRAGREDLFCAAKDLPAIYIVGLRKKLK
jgi:ubiquinone/menaquinone biosynthesis C-methylase UbiE